MATSWTVLSDIIDAEELELLVDSTRNKLEQHLKKISDETETLRAQNELFRLDSEQRIFELEKQMIDCKSSLDSESNRATEYSAKANEYEKKAAELSAQLHRLEETCHNTENEQMQHNRIIEQLELKTRDLTELLEKRERDAERRAEEIKVMSEQLALANKSRCEAIAQSEEMASRDVTVQYREQRMEQERQLLQNQIEWANKELSERTQELNTVRREKSTQLIQLQNQLDQVTEELKASREMTTTLKDCMEKQMSKNESLAQKLKDARDAQVAMEENFQQQLRAQTKLSELYKSSAEDNQTKIDELVTAVEELQKVVSQTEEGYRQQEEALLQNETALKLELEEVKNNVSLLQKELDNANNLLACFRPKGLSVEKIASMSPSAAIASNLLKSGMTLSQIYTEYMTTTDQLRIEKHENQRLNQYVEQILQEIEDRAPQLKRQKDEYEKTIEINARLSQQLEMALTEFEKMRVETEDCNRKHVVFEKDNKRLRLQTTDLSNQVRTLLKEIEEMRGGLVIEEDANHDEITSSEQLITTKLVTFKNIEDLQMQNQQLLMVVRELSEKQEAAEKEDVKSKMSELQQTLDAALNELAELRDTRVKQSDLVDSIVRQRDMYRVLLNQSGISATSPVFTSTPATASGTAAITSPPSTSRLSEVKEALSQLQEDFAQYRREKAANDKEFMDQIEKTRDESSEFRLQSAKLSAQLEHANERYKILQSNMEGCKKENSALVDKNQRLNAQVLRHEQIADVLRQDLLSAQEKCARVEVALENLKAERDLLKSVEARLVQEKEIFLREQKGHEILMANLQAIQNNLERSESETKMHLSAQIESLEKENNNLRRKLDGEKEQYKAAVNAWEKEVRDVRNKLETELTNGHKSREELLKNFSQLDAVKKELAETKAKLEAAETHLKRMVADAGGKGTNADTRQSEIKDLNFELINVKSENKALKDQINQTKQHMEQYKSIANSVEQELKKEIETNNVLKETMEKRLQENLELHSELEKKIEALEKEKRELLDQNQQLLVENLSQSSNLRKLLASTQLELQTALQRAEVAATTEEQAKNDCQAQLRLAQEAQDRYEHELILHAADVQVLSNVKLQLEEAKNQLPSIQEMARTAEQTLLEQKSSWEEQINIIKTEKQSLEERCVQLESQNSHLHNQMELLSTQMVALQSRSSQEPLNISLSDDVSKSSDQLLEIIRFLRRDKEIAMTKLEVTNAENERYKSKMELMEKQIDELQRTANENMQKSQSMMTSAAEHAELIRKVEMVNVLNDSNRLLREEKDSFAQSKQELDIKLKQVEKELAPLQEKNRELAIQRDTFASESQVLKNEVKRWQTRTSQLVEQCNRTSPDELKKANLEKENLQKQTQQLNEEIQRHRAEMSRLNNSLLSVQNEVTTLKANSAKEKKENDKVNEEIKKRDIQMNDLNKTVQQVKKIGRKYKTQYDELKVQYDELKSKSDEAAVGAGDAASSNVAMKQELENKLQEADTKVKTLTEQTNKLTEELTVVKKSEEELKERSKKVLLNCRQKISELSNQRDAMIQEMDDMKKKMGVAESASEEGNLRLNSLRSQYEGRISRLEKELKEAQEEKENIQQEKEKIQKESEELLNKVTQQQKQFIQYQAAKVSPTPSTALMTGSTSSETPPTANIKPLATPTTAPVHRGTSNVLSSRTTPTASIRPMAIPQARKITQTSTSTATTAIESSHDESSTASTHSPPLVPQATVAPTPATLVVTVTVTPTTTTNEQNTIASVAPVATVMDDNQPDADPGIIGMPSSSTSPTPSTSDAIVDATSLVTPSAAVSNVVSATTVTMANSEENSSGVNTKWSGSNKCDSPGESGSTSDLEFAPGNSKAEVVPADANTSEVTPSSSSAYEHDTKEVASKRHREEVVGEEDPEHKRSRLVLSPSKQDDVVELTSSSDVVVDGSSYEAVTSTSTELVADVVKGVQATDVASSASGIVEQLADESQHEVILVESDDDAEAILRLEPADEEYDREVDDDDELRGDDEDDDEDDVEEGMEGEFSQDPQLESDEQMQDDDEEDETEGPADTMDEEQFEDIGEEMAETPTDDDVIEIIDDAQDRMEVQDEPPPPQPAPPTTSPQMATRASLLPRNRTERGPSIRRQQLSTFVPLGHGAHFDDGDDSIVPSTPTLYVSRRSDGFAEAVNSPHVPHGRFVFGASQEMVVPTSHSIQLATQGGMDETRMDLSQLDENSGRSVPTTPLQVSPPIENETLPPPTSPSPVVPEVAQGGGDSSSLSIQEILVESEAEGVIVSDPIVEEPDVETEAIRLVAEEVASSAECAELAESRLPEVVPSQPPSRASTPQRRPTPIIWNDPGYQGPSRGRPPRLTPARRMRVMGARGGMQRGGGGAPFRGRMMGRSLVRRPRRGRPF